MKFSTFKAFFFFPRPPKKCICAPTNQPPSSTASSLHKPSAATTPFDDDYPCNIEDYDILVRIGIGSFGRVYAAEVKGKTGKTVAIKKLAKRHIICNQHVDHVYNEKLILHAVDHPFIIKLHTWFQDEACLYLVLEHIRGGEIFFYLRERRKLSCPQARFYAAQVVLVFEYLHKLNILYRDLKPENVLLGEDGYIKMTDFGFAKHVDGRTYTLCGTPEYLAPEILLQKGHGKPADWWTLGVFLYELLVGMPPFSGSTTIEIYRKINLGRIQYPRWIDPHAKSLISKLCMPSVAKRIGDGCTPKTDVKRCPFFVNVNWNRLFNKQYKPPYVPRIMTYDDSHDSCKENKDPSLREDPLPSPDPFQDW